jgi:hypothetical protein
MKKRINISCIGGWLKRDVTTPVLLWYVSKLGTKIVKGLSGCLDVLKMHVGRIQKRG